MKIAVIVHPQSRQPRMDLKDDVWHIYVTEPAKENKANQAVIATLAKHFRIPKTKISLRSGAKSKLKIFTWDE